MNAGGKDLLDQLVQGREVVVYATDYTESNSYTASAIVAVYGYASSDPCSTRIAVDSNMYIVLNSRLPAIVHPSQYESPSWLLSST